LKRIIAAAIGECVHVAGLFRFLRLAEEAGCQAAFLGTAVSIPELIGAVVESDPDIVALSYRLTPEAAERLFLELKEAVHEAGLGDKRFIFGGTLPVCQVAEQVGLFEAIFSGHTMTDEVISYLRGEHRRRGKEVFPETLVERVRAKAPFPLLRHHFGRPTMEETLGGIRRIAESRVVDIISLGPDQNAQSCFFRPEEMDHTQDGAGGVPVRTPDDFRDLYVASRRGNYPLLRSYAGTRDLLKMAEMLRETIHNAWAAIPLCWYNELDGRGKRPVVEGIAESQRVMRWHAEHGIPVEVNESHHWSLRDAPDGVCVAAAFLAAYNARAAGVQTYVSQYMFNTPPGMSLSMDLAKKLAKLDRVESLHTDRFTSFRQTRAGLSSFPADMDAAKGQLAMSVFVQMAVRPQIVHVVSFSEADHAATASDVVESCKIARGVVRNCLEGMPDLTLDPRVAERRAELREEAELLLQAIREIAAPGVKDPWTDPETLAQAIRMGILDAPHLAGNPHAAGRVQTRIIDGCCRAVDEAGNPLTERRRLEQIWDEYRYLP